MVNASEMADTILPPPSSSPEEGFRMPYANELILLSFEGHLKPFRPAPLKYGPAPSYVPGAPAPTEPPRRSFIQRLRRCWAELVG